MSFCRETEKCKRQRGNSLLNRDLKMNYMVPLMIFLIIDATQIAGIGTPLPRRKMSRFPLTELSFPGKKVDFSSFCHRENKETLRRCHCVCE
jgi:hypothetical protein